MIITHSLLQYSQHKLLLFYFTREREGREEERMDNREEEMR